MANKKTTVEPAIIPVAPVHGRHSRKRYNEADFVSVPRELLVRIQDEGDAHSNYLATEALMVARRRQDKADT